MKPKLYLDRRSPPVRAVLMLIEAFQIDIEENPIDLFKGEHYHDNFLEKNPLHTVPIFENDEVTLTDSHAIMIYLCEQYSNVDNNRFWPSDRIERIKVLNRLFYSGTLLFRRDSDLLTGIYVNQWKKDEIEKHLWKICEQYDILEMYLTKNKFIACDHITIADISVVTIVSTIDMIVPITNDKWPKLHNWWRNHMEKLPYYHKANHDGLLALKEIIQQSTDFEINFN